MDSYLKASFIDKNAIEQLLGRVITLQSVREHHVGQIESFYARLAEILSERSFTSMEFVTCFVSSLLGGHLSKDHSLVPLLLQACGHFAKELTVDDAFADEVEEIMQQYLSGKRGEFC